MSLFEEFNQKINEKALEMINYRGYFGDKRLQDFRNEIAQKMAKKSTVVLNQLSDSLSL